MSEVEENEIQIIQSSVYLDGEFDLHHLQFRVFKADRLPDRFGWTRDEIVGTTIKRGDWYANFPELDWQSIEFSHYCGDNLFTSWYLSSAQRTNHCRYIRFYHKCGHCQTELPEEVKEYFNKVNELYY